MYQQFIRQAILWQKVLLDNPLVSWFPTRKIVKVKARKHLQCHLLFSLITAPLLHVEEMRPIDMVTLKQEEWGEGFLAAGLCSDAIIIYLPLMINPLKSWVSFLPPPLPPHPVSFLDLFIFMQYGVNVIVNKECQWGARSAVTFFLHRHWNLANPPPWPGLTSHRNRSSKTWLACSFKKHFTTLLTSSVFWHSFF